MAEKKAIKKEYDFGEKKKEYDAQSKQELEVWISPKYEESKKKAIEMIEDSKYNLTTADFWILMRKTAGGKMGYVGLIISHNGCLKINDALDNKVKPDGFELDKDGYNKSLVYTYKDDEVYEVGEFSADNGKKNGYPYAMAFKRCFDRVVLKKSKLAYSGIYSEVEADEFEKRDSADTGQAPKNAKSTQNVEETANVIMIQDVQKDKIKELCTPDEIKNYLQTCKKTKLSELTLLEASNLIKTKKVEE